MVENIQKKGDISKFLGILKYKSKELDKLKERTKEYRKQINEAIPQLHIFSSFPLLLQLHANSFYLPQK